MSKRSIYGESSSTAHNQYGTAPQDESPLPLATSSLAQASSSSIPKIPLDLIADLILPFIADRATWNNVYCAGKDLCLAAKNMTPPWPNTILNLGHAVSQIVFSPSGSQLAFGINTHQPVVHIWDRWGKKALLAGHTRRILCLEYSSDGEYLASGSRDGSILLWHTELFHAASSKLSREIPTAITEQADIILPGIDEQFVTALSFSRTDSNILASGGSNGGIKLWNVKDQTCIHSFDPNSGTIHALFFAGGADISCIAVANNGSIIRLWKAEGSSYLGSEIIAVERHVSRAVFSPSGSLLATSSYYTWTKSTVALCDLETMTKTQSVTMPRPSCFAVSQDSKQLVVGGHMGRIRLLQSDTFSIQRDLNTRGRSPNMAVAVAFDPTCRVLAFGCSRGTVELLTL